MFLPTTIEEVKKLGWDALDIILISGDSYIDSPFMGVSLLGKLLFKHGYKVGIIAQPDPVSAEDITRLGEPTLFWGVSGGAIDSMVANYTATQKKRRQDDYTPGGINNKRPDRAVLVYANLIRRYFKDTKPIVLGGIEASLRRITHYDYWKDQLRAPILFDAKADYLLYGMAETSILALASALKNQQPVTSICGLAYLAKTPPSDYLVLPSFEECQADPDAFIRMFHQFYQNHDHHSARGLAQKKGDRYYIQNPPCAPLTTQQMDDVYQLEFSQEQHPYYAQFGDVKALETIRFSVPTHRGCYGECNFCAIAVHEGRQVSWRSQPSILASIKALTQHPKFKGYISDLSGPTANMYGYECHKKLACGVCNDKRCVFPYPCPVLKTDHDPQLKLLQAARAIPKVKKVFVASGIRYDLLLSDKTSGQAYLEEIAEHHVSGQLKIAPEHTDPAVLSLMGKPDTKSLTEFKTKFDAASKKYSKKQFLTYYFIAAYPGCSDLEMKKLRDFSSQVLKVTPEQVQVFTPLPSTYASIMYYTEKDPFTGKRIFVEKGLAKKQRQKDLLTQKIQFNRSRGSA